ncbi:hypothetical protein NF212_11390 [Parasalinivibrio latis]|uniref:hypothetical protein n=1 Tax=Parasalinivibrio latis TaxID=2952610 RepID=UPI0030E17E21
MLKSKICYTTAGAALLVSVSVPAVEAFCFRHPATGIEYSLHVGESVNVKLLNEDAQLQVNPSQETDELRIVPSTVEASNFHHSCPDSEMLKKFKATAAVKQQ